MGCKVQISEIAKVKGGKRLPKGVHLQSKQNAHPYIRVRDFNCRTLELNDAFEYVDDETQKSIRQYIVSTGDVLVTIVGTIGLTAIVGQSLDGANLTENCVKISGLDSVDSEYLYYYLSSPFGQQEIARRTVGAVQPKLPIKNIRSMEIDYPTREERERIVALLSLLDDKVEFNSRINDYLAELGDALFNRECPQSNEPNAILSDIAQVTMGQSPSGSSYNEDGNGEVFYQGRAEFGAFFPRRRLFTTEPKRMAREGDTLMSVRAPVGDLNIANEDCCIGRGLAAIHSENNQSFVHYLVRAQGRQLDTFNGDGTVFGSINGKSLKKLTVYLPSSDVIARIESRLEPIDALIRRNDDEMQALERMRDTLLPRLMSGEIDVSKVDLTQPNNHFQEDE